MKSTKSASAKGQPLPLFISIIILAIISVQYSQPSPVMGAAQPSPLADHDKYENEQDEEMHDSSDEILELDDYDYDDYDDDHDHDDDDDDDGYDLSDEIFYDAESEIGYDEDAEENVCAMSDKSVCGACCRNQGFDLPFWNVTIGQCLCYQSRGERNICGGIAANGKAAGELKTPTEVCRACCQANNYWDSMFSDQTGLVTSACYCFEPNFEAFDATLK